MRGPNEYTALRLSRGRRRDTKMSLKHLSSRKTANLSNKARAFSIASLVHKGRWLFVLYPTVSARLFARNRYNVVFRFLEELADIRDESDDKISSKDLSTDREKLDTLVPRKKLKTLKPEAVLEGKELWNCFYRLGTEMIITKTGRSVKLYLLHVRAISPIIIYLRSGNYGELHRRLSFSGLRI